MPDQKVYELPVEPLVTRVGAIARVEKDRKRKPGDSFPKIDKETCRVTYPGVKDGDYEEPRSRDLDVKE